MSILIDPPRWPAHGTLFSHLVSDASLQQLHAFAAGQGISPRAFDRDHYDVPAERYEQLVAAGARPVAGSELVRALVAAGLRIPARHRPEKLDAILLRRWDKTLPGTPELGAALLERWSQPHRHYHDRVHLLSMLEALDLLMTGTGGHGSAQLLALAAWFHDAVYEGTAQDELHSAQLAASELRSLLPAAQVAEVERLVLLTADHRPDAGDVNGALLCDADLEVLARDWPAYQRYAQAVATEYSHVPPRDFAAGRIAVLEQLAASGTLYSTPAAVQRWEAGARANLAREIRGLREQLAEAG